MRGVTDLLNEDDSDDSEENEEEDSLKSDINTAELNHMDSQPYKSSRTGKNLVRGNTKFKRQQIKIAKKKDGPAEDKDTKANINRKKSRALKRK